MASFNPENFVAVQNLLAFAVAIMLMAGGLAFIVSGNRMQSELLARRVKLVEPRVASAMADQSARQASDDPFRRPSQPGTSAVSEREIIRVLSRLRVPGNRALTVYTAIRFTVATILGTLAWLWTRNIAAFASSPLMPIVILAMAAIVAWFLPAMFIAYGVKQRTKQVRSGLPDALELLVVCVEAGLSFEDGLDRVVVELRRSQPALADELGLTLADLRILPSREQALTNLAERVNLPSLRSVVTTLSQTLRYGTPLAQALRVVSAEMRNDFLIELEERANRLPALMTLPVMLFLMPTIFVIVGGPAALRLLDSFHR